MKPHRSTLLFLVLLLVVTACTQTPTPVIVPTLAVLPSPTPTDTPSITPIPTWTPSLTPTETPSNTPTFTATFTPTATATFTASPTFTATHTLIPSVTRPATLTPTATFTFTPSATPTSTSTASNTPLPSATFTPTATATNAAPNILSFGASMSSVLPNTTIQLAWTTNAETARLEQVTAQGGLTQVYPVSPSGQFSIVVPGTFGRVIYYRLVAIRNGVQAQQTIPINIACPFNWFFGNQYVVPDADCPTQPISAEGRYQPFERGVMLYVSANGLNRIYGLQNEGSLYAGVVNGWDGSTTNDTAPPNGRYMPQEMFNWAYYNTLAPIGSWSSALGWGTANITNAPRTIQWENSVGGGNVFYIDAPDGAVYRFSGGDSGTWSRVR